MIVRKENKLSNPLIIMQNEKELDFMINMCYTTLDSADDKEIREFAELIIDKLS
jgi:hypothetical protein